MENTGLRARPEQPESSASVRMAEVFARQRGGEAFAALHRILSTQAVRRLTVATLDANESSPVRFEYHADLGEATPEPLDPQTLALALGCQRTTLLPVVEPIRRTAGALPIGRLAHALVAPLRCGGRQVGFCLAQSETPFAADTIEDVGIAVGAAAVKLHKRL